MSIRNAIATWVAQERLSTERKKNTWARRGFNLFPSHWFAGGKAVHFSPEDRQVLMVLKRTWRTMGWFGHLSGGKMYSATDPLPLTLLYNSLDNKRDYVIWDKQAEICYLKPAYGRVLVANIRISDTQRDNMLSDLAQNGVHTATVDFTLNCLKGEVHATVRKVVHVETKSRFRARKEQSSLTPASQANDVAAG